MCQRKKETLQKALQSLLILVISDMLRSCSHFNSRNNSDSSKVCKYRRTTVAKERKCKSDNGCETKAHAYVLKNLCNKHSTDTCANQITEGVITLNRNIEASYDKCYKQNENQHTADKAEFFT